MSSRPASPSAPELAAGPTATGPALTDVVSFVLDLANQNTIFITNTISLDSDVSSMEDTANFPNCESVTLLEARFPNQGWLNVLWKSALICHLTFSLIGN